MERRWRNHPLVRERDHRRIFWLWSMLAAMVIAALPAGAYLYHQNRCLEVSYEVSAVAEERERLLEEERRLRVERARLESLGGIERWALRERGLVRPDTDDVVVVELPGDKSYSEAPTDRLAAGRGPAAEASFGEAVYR
jgi:cell division protein FtsL